MLEKKQGNFQRARDLLVKGSRLVPASKANPYLFQELGAMAAERGRVQEAREHFREGTRTEAGARSAVLWQAWAMLETREPDGGEQARKLFQKSLAVDPENKYAYLSWATYEARCGFADRARSLLRKGCKLNPGDPPLLQALARLEAKEGNLEAARALFEQGTKLDPAHQANWQAWAIAEWRAGRVDRARELLQRGVWVAPRSRNACKLFQAWGVLEEREGNVALARQLYKCGVKADPTSETTWLTWAKMEERLENPIRAQELRTLCVQQRAEALVGQSDLSPAAMFGIIVTTFALLFYQRGQFAKRYELDVEKLLNSMTGMTPDIKQRAQRSTLRAQWSNTRNQTARAAANAIGWPLNVPARRCQIADA